MAARHGALIVPFAGIGLDDSFEILLDGEEIRGESVAAQRKYTYK